MRRQPTIRGVTRVPVSSALIHRVEAAIDREMRRYDVSRSFVIATCCAFALGVEEQADYKVDPDTDRGSQRKKVKSRR